MKLSLRETVGVVLWWAEGTKSRKDKRWVNARSYPIEMTNTDPKIIKAFLDFIRYDLCIDEPKLKLQLQIHRGDNKQQLEQYWSKATDIPKNRFNKTIIRPAGNKIGKSRGTCKVRLANKEQYKALEKKLVTVLEKLKY